MYRSKFGLGRLKERRWQAYGVAGVAVVVVGAGLGIASAGETVPTVNCPQVAVNVAVPAQQRADVQKNLELLNTQIDEANQRLRSTVGQGGPDFVNNAILGPLKDKRFATINRIETAIGRNAPKPDLNAEARSPCTLNKNGGTPQKQRTTVATTAATAKASTPAAPKSPAATTSAAPAPTTQAPAPAQPGAKSPAGSPVAVNGRLSVCGVHLCNQSGTAIQLRGMSSHGLQFFPNCVNANSLAALRNDWKADFVRLSMYVQEGGLASDPTGFTAKVNGLVDDATALGLYVVVDFHILTPGDPNFNLGLAKTFFANVTAKHAGNTNVLYEIANEPNGVRWTAIKSYADQVIPVIRKSAPESVVLVGTRGFSSLGLTDGSDEKEILADPIDFKNVMYTFHFYAASHGADRRAVVARAATELPLFVTEFGSQTFTGDGTNDFASTTAWLDLLKANKISYGMWSFSDGHESNSVFKQGTCAGTTFAGPGVLTPAGRYLRSRILTGVGNPN
ncbi:glycoside hydrolase family 5 protein [Actinoplanes sp. KI2]|uniref:glycoside hydrolase family 5 protein n=1 Tax=Actinoplanes sp. KI2 TaxID=2983315 RepID=UPI0021D5A1A6|nr:glycoside hydrolase family 5 protein [Actinoplanes sp. KI2]MCU7728461.1 glycoside hydrolase family 5 protein [Actinoplanes sp. KI2]